MYAIIIKAEQSDQALEMCGGFPVEVRPAFVPREGDWLDGRSNIARDDTTYTKLVARALAASPVTEVQIRPAPEVTP